ncbi:CGNR zinc finger domain-containing protein [uncultured Jatrophihabitans sp.]|uniref:CGNR zinc finger domain-containing protein n=1 Tax=uncultured Jatrophihabitans sp. TaxID=1610747 RepID=UPI0035CA4900
MDLALTEDFLNTIDERTFAVQGKAHVPGDALTSPATLATWLAAHGFSDEVGDRELEAARSLRSALRAALGTDSTDATARALARFPLRLTPDDSGRLQVAASTGVRGLDTIVETVAVSVADGGWRRMKLCASPDCRWAFHDASRNGAGRWCSMGACGNRHKTRAYRQRQA